MIKTLVRFVLSALIVFAGFYLVISLCVLLFMITGRLTAGESMYFDLVTPAYPQLLAFQVACVSVIAVLLFFRKRLGVSGDALS